MGGLLVSPCRSVRPSVCPSVDRVVSALYLLQYSRDPFYMYTSCQATSGVSRVKVIQTAKNWSFGKLFKFVTLTWSCFDLGSNMSWSIVWVIMGWRGVSPEHRRSSCSSFFISRLRRSKVYWCRLRLSVYACLRLPVRSSHPCFRAN